MGKSGSCKCEGGCIYPHTYPHTDKSLFANMLLWLGEGVRVKRLKKRFFVNLGGIYCFVYIDM